MFVIRGEITGNQKKVLIAMFFEGLAAYKTRQWEHAMTVSQYALQIDPEDKPSHLYIERCSEYIRHPPSDDWDGVFVMRTK